MNKISLKNIFQGRTNSEKDIHSYLTSKEKFDIRLNYKNIKNLQPKCIDYDANNKILAIGYVEGIIKIQGKPGYEYILHNNGNNSELQTVTFIPNKNKLLSVFHNQILIWNLINHAVDIKYDFDDRISSIHYSVLSNTIYVGLANGYVKKIRTEFDVPSSIDDIFDKESYENIIHEIIDKEIVGIQLNPKKISLLAIAYKSGQIIEWDLIDNKVIKSFYYDSNLTSLCWNSSGTKIYATYHNGDICSFKTKKSDSKPQNIISQKNLNIKKIISVSSSDGAIYFLLFSCNRKIGMLKNKDMELFYVCDENQTIVDLHVTQKSHKSNYIIVITDKGNVIVHKMNNMNSSCIVEPKLKTIDQDNNVIFMRSYEISESFYQHLIMVNNSKIKCHSSWPISGSISNDYLDKRKSILVTLHNDCNLNIWDISNHTISHIYTIKVNSDSTCFTLCQYSRKLIVGSNDGMIHVYLFCIPPKKENICLSDKPDDSVIQNDDSHIESPRKNQSKKDKSSKKSKKKHSKKKERKKEDLSESEDSSDKEAKKVSKKKKAQVKNKENVSPSSENITSNESEDIQSGFILFKQLNLKKPIKYINYEEKDDFLLIGTVCGDFCVLSIKDLSNPKLLFYEERVALSISKAFVTESLIKDVKVFLIILFCETGKIIIINLDEKKIINKINRKNLFIQSYLIDPYRSLPQEQWNEIHEVVYDDNIFVLNYTEKSTEDDDTNNQCTIITKADLDEKVAEIKQGLKSSKKSLSRSMSNTGYFSDQYIVYCSINEMCIINIPQLTFVQRIKLSSSMGWFGKLSQISNESDSYIFGIDHDLKIHFFRMKDLKSIKDDESFNLHGIGINDISPLQMKHGITQNNDQLIVYTKDKELSLLHLWCREDKSNDKINKVQDHKKAKTDILELHHEDRKKLLGEENLKKSKQDDAEDITKTLSETKEKLNERGNRLEALAEKTSMMRSESEQFAKLSKQLLDKNKKKI